MVELAYNIQQKPVRGVEIVVHVDDTLGEEKRNDLTGALSRIDGIYAADFCSLRWHLMLVQYDRQCMTSQDVLDHVNSQGVHAELIGPV
jgi:hypothetical protein